MSQNETVYFTTDSYPLIHAQDFAESKNGCHVIKVTNSSSSFAEAWESIPETLILNSAIGLVLFITFITLTRIAWSRADSPDALKTQNLITFLYGYRDPEQWYVIPRFEFLRPEDRHHHHDLLYPYIYVPPKLPLVNPLELIAGGPDDPKSLDSERALKDTESGGAVFGRPVTGMGSQLAKSFKSLGTTKMKSAEESIASDPITSMSTMNNSSSAFSSGVRASSAVPGSASPGTGKDFYPSILTAEQLQASYLSRKLNKFFGIFFQVSDSDLIYARGIDAYEYLLFQRHLILIMFVTSILCVGVILPIHWFAGSPPQDSLELVQGTSFQRSTIKSIASMTTYHWAHIVCAGVIVFTTLRVMSSYRSSIITSNDAQISRRTLLIGNIPTNQRTRSKLTRIIEEYFPRNTVEAIQFVYNSKTLYDDEMYLSSIIAAKDYCQAYKRKMDREIWVHKTDVNQGRVCDGYCRLCSFFYICCCYWPVEKREPGTVYYAKEEEKYRKRVATTCDRIVKEPTEYAFVTFKSYRQARRVIAELANLKQDAIEGRPDRRQRSMARQIKTVNDFTSRRIGKRLTDPDTIDSDEAAKHKSKFIELSTRHPSIKDPLDPLNDPHVRSIRLPYIKSASSDDSSKGTGSPLPNHNRGNSPSQRGKSQLTVKTVDSGSGRKSLNSLRGNTVDWSLDPLEGPITWSVRYAPHPDNVEFNDLINLGRTSRYTILLLHCLMVIIFIFITTPNVILSMIDRVYVVQPDKARELSGIQKLALNYLPILLQIATTALLPALVALISKQIPYEDSSTKSHSIMWKVYAFLVLMVIVMPSIGMSSAQALFAQDIDPKCLFPTDNGAYYINYVVSSIFLSTLLELIKPLDILNYCFIFWTSRSSAEIEAGRQFIEREFSVGMQHTAVLLIFSVVMTYCISCPLIAPVGLIYLCVKHAVDHYHLYYSYFTKKVDKDLQTTIVMFVKVALLLMLFQTTIAIWINTGASYFALLSQLIFWITLATLGFNCFFDCTARTTDSQKRARYNHEFCACFYLPKVVASLLRMDAIPSKYISRKV